MGYIKLTMAKVGGTKGSSDKRLSVRPSKESGYHRLEFASGASLSAPGGVDAYAILWINKATAINFGGGTGALSVNIASSTLEFLS